MIRDSKPNQKKECGILCCFEIITVGVYALSLEKDFSIRIAAIQRIKALVHGGWHVSYSVLLSYIGNI